MNKNDIEESNNQYYYTSSQCSLLDNTSQGRLVSNILLNLIESLENYLLKIGRIDYINGYFDWDFHLLDSSFVNAFCMVGGKVLVYSGILSIADNEEKIAYILAHEIAHALLNHPRNHIIVKDREYNNVLLFRPFSISQELEADRLGMMILKWADYDISKIPSFCDSIKSNDNRFNYFSTHPLDENRIKNMENLIMEINDLKDIYYAPIIKKDDSIKMIYKKRYMRSRAQVSKDDGFASRSQVSNGGNLGSSSQVSNGGNLGSSSHVSNESTANSKYYSQNSKGLDIGSDSKGNHNKHYHNHKILCPDCGFYQDSDAVFCSNCGSRLDDKARCKRCGAIIGKDDMFCTNCGNVLADDLRCFNCGEKIRPGDVFCVNCGIKLIR